MNIIDMLSYFLITLTNIETERYISKFFNNRKTQKLPEPVVRQLDSENSPVPYAAGDQTLMMLLTGATWLSISDAPGISVASSTMKMNSFTFTW